MGAGAMGGGLGTRPGTAPSAPRTGAGTPARTGEFGGGGWGTSARGAGYGGTESEEDVETEGEEELEADVYNREIPEGDEENEY